MSADNIGRNNFDLFQFCALLQTVLFYGADETLTQLLCDRTGAPTQYLLTYLLTLLHATTPVLTSDDH